MSDSFITASLPAGQERWRPDPFPGSEPAFLKGCTCPELQPWPGQLRFNMACPVHQLERTAS